MFEVKPEHIRQIMESYEECLDDLGADYIPEFMEWYSKKEPETFMQWQQRFYEPGQEHDSFDTSHDLLGSMSNSFLEGLIDRTKHDTLLAEFCNQNALAKAHIEELLKDMENGN